MLRSATFPPVLRAFADAGARTCAARVAFLASCRLTDADGPTGCHPALPTYKDRDEMTTMNDNKLRPYRSLEMLIQSQLAALTGPEQGIVVVLPHAKRLDAYTTVGSGVNVGDPESLKQLKWIRAEKAGPGWMCVEVEPAERDDFIGRLKR